MSILIGIGIVTTVSVFYLGRKGWYAFHKAVGITPGVLVYHDTHAPLVLSNISWQQLNFNKKHLKSLADSQLRQLHRIDEKVARYHAYQAEIKLQEKKPQSPSNSSYCIKCCIHVYLKCSVVIVNWQLLDQTLEALIINHEMKLASCCKRY